MFSRNQKLLTIGLVVLLIAGLLVGCGGNEQSSQDPAQGDQEKKAESILGDIYFVGATQGGGGVWDMVGTGLANVIQQNIPGSRITFVPGEGLANVKTIHKGEGDLGFMHSTMAFAASQGKEPFDAVYDNVRALFSVYDPSMQFVVLKSFPIDSLAELAEKKPAIRLAVGDPGSITELASRALLEEYGITYKDIESWGGSVQYKSMGEAADMMGDRLIDAISITGTAPMGALQEVATSQDLKMLSIDKEVVDRIVERYGFSPAVVPKDAYPFLEADVPTFSFRVIIGTPADTPEDDIYQIVKAVGENLDYMHNVHTNLQNLSLEYMAEGTGISLHPGAEKYYREMGVID
ncbi:MAG: TAXI family TRAP transporter solute-binding subunit [Bacillota bacterium]|jgi:TRAP transporter TAXI family solute receptor